MRKIKSVVPLLVLFFLVLMILVCSISNVIEWQKIQTYNNMAPYENKENGDFHLVDLYDTDESNIYDFFAEKQSLQILIDTYEMLDAYEGQYIELMMQPLEYLGVLMIDKTFTDGNDNEQINQTVNGTDFFTPLKAIQVSDSTAELYNLNDEMESLHQYGDKTNNIGVLLGSAYYGVMEKGDEFDACYLGSKTIHCVVVGFLDDDAKIVIDGTDIPLDHYILSRNIDYDDDDDDTYKKILLSVKCEGYLHYENKKERSEAVDFIKYIKKTTGYKYEIPRIKKELRTIFQMGIIPSGILLIFTVTLYIVLCRKIFQKYVNECGRDLKIKYVIVTSSIVAMSIVSYYMAAYLFRDYSDLLSNAFSAYTIIAIVLCVFSAGCDYNTLVLNQRGKKDEVTE